MRQKPWFLIIILLSFCNSFIIGQSCDTPTSLTQEIIDNFSITYPGCTEINGNVFIHSSVSDLSGLEQITKINGYLNIGSNDNLLTLKGLQNIDTITNKLEIKYNSFLTNLDSLYNLEYVGERLSIQNNSNLNSLVGLSKLKKIGLHFTIMNNGPLNSLMGLSSLDSIGGSLFIGQNEITSLYGLNNLGYVGENLNISNCSLISSLEDLTNLTNVQGDIEITNNASLANLIGLDNLNSINGSLTIRDNQSILNLQGLENISSVAGDFTIENLENLTNLESLENLTNVNGKLLIRSNEILNSLSGLNNLESVGELEIFRQSEITDLLALNNLSIVSGDFKLDDLPSVTNLNGLNNLVSIGGVFWLEELGISTMEGLNNLSYAGGMVIRLNFILQNLSGLSSLSALGADGLNIGITDINNLDGLSNLLTVEGGVNISDNILSLEGLDNLFRIGGLLNISDSQISNLNGLSSLNSIGGLVLNNNDGLISLQGLENLDSLKNEISLSNNNLLNDISNLDSIPFIDISSLSIDNNFELSFCDNTFICNYIFDEDNYGYITNNAPGCDSREEILESCSNRAKFFTQVFWDLNQNALLDDFEHSIGDNYLLLNPGDITLFTNSEVSYTHLWPGTYNISYVPNSLWELTTDSISYTVDISGPEDSDTIRFGIKPILETPKMDPFISSPQTRCNEWVIFNVLSKNIGTTLTDGTIWFEVDSLITEFEYIDVPDTIISPNIFGWHYLQSIPGDDIAKKIKLKIPSEGSIGQKLQFKSWCTYSYFGLDYNSRIFQYCQEVACAYDPNDKLVNPIYPENYSLIGEHFIYTIRFQNTGNAEAYNVVIEDQINVNLDPSTFSVVASSHDTVLSTTIRESKLIEFRFENIFLPDSTTNLEGSQGFVAYRIKAFSDIPEFTNVLNNAEIYFDFNPPIITNTTENIMITSFDADEDGFDFYVDCDDHNPDVNPSIIEVPYNGLNDDCDNLTPDDDLDQDGFGIDLDCDDNNPNISPEVEEIVYNGVDDDCDELTLDDDLDQDGFLLAEDCDDNNPNINPNVEEIAYNGINDDCNVLTLDDDLDQDGFLLAEDCDDTSADIYPGAEEIPNNSIDEDCDGEDLIVSETNNNDLFLSTIYPNPSNGRLNIILENKKTANCFILDYSGRILSKTVIKDKATLELSHLDTGIYLIYILGKNESSLTKIVKL